MGNSNLFVTVFLSDLKFDNPFKLCLVYAEQLVSNYLICLLFSMESGFIPNLIVWCPSEQHLSFMTLKAM